MHVHQHASNAHVSGGEELYTDRQMESEDEETGEYHEEIDEGDSGIQEARGMADGDEASLASDNTSVTKEPAVDGASDVTQSDVESISTDGGDPLPAIKMMKIPVDDDVQLRNLHNVGWYRYKPKRSTGD